MARGVEAGKAHITMTFNADAMRKGLKTAGDRLKKLGELAKVAAIPLAGIATAALKNFAELGDELDKMSDRTGVSVEALSQLKFAAEQSGAQFDQLSDALKDMNIRLGQLRQGNQSVADAFGRLGLSARDFERLNTEQSFTKIADELSRIPDVAQRSAAAVELFGESGFRILPLINQGAAGIATLREEAEQLTGNFTGAQADNAKELADSWNRLQTAFSGLLLQAAAFAAPGMVQVFQAGTDYLAAARQVPDVVERMFAAARQANLDDVDTQTLWERVAMTGFSDLMSILPGGRSVTRGTATRGNYARLPASTSPEFLESAVGGSILIRQMDELVEEYRLLRKQQQEEARIIADTQARQLTTLESIERGLLDNPPLLITE